MIIRLQGGGRVPVLQLPDTRLTGDGQGTADVVLIRMTRFFRTRAARDYGTIGAIPAGMFSPLDRNYHPVLDRAEIRVVYCGVISEGRAAPDIVARAETVSPDPRHSLTGVVDPLAFWRACMLGTSDIADRVHVSWQGFESTRPGQVRLIKYSAELLTPASPNWDVALDRRSSLRLAS